MRIPIRTLLVLLAGMTLAAAPASAHKEHRLQRQQAEQIEGVQATTAASDSDAGDDVPFTDVLVPSDVAAEKSFLKRLQSWLGRLHPAIVHFPVAFFPAALLAAFAARKRPHWHGTMRFLVIAGGILAPIAALLGWLDVGLSTAKDDALMSMHRWLGTAIGFGGLGLAVWTLAAPGEKQLSAMRWALAAMTAAILVQGWYGGALVHGADHLAF